MWWIAMSYWWCQRKSQIWWKTIGILEFMLWPCDIDVILPHFPDALWLLLCSTILVIARFKMDYSIHAHTDTLRTSGAQIDQWRCWEFLTVLDNVLIKLLLCLTLVSSCGLLWSVSLYQFTQTITFSCETVTVIEQRGILGLEKLNMCLGTVPLLIQIIDGWSN